MIICSMQELTHTQHWPGIGNKQLLTSIESGQKGGSGMRKGEREREREQRAERGRRGENHGETEEERAERGGRETAGRVGRREGGGGKGEENERIEQWQTCANINKINITKTGKHTRLAAKHAMHTRIDHTDNMGKPNTQYCAQLNVCNTLRGSQPNIIIKKTLHDSIQCLQQARKTSKLCK